MKNTAGMVKQGVILAAGRGSRAFPLSQSYPKSLLPIFNKPVMQYQLEVMRDAGIRDIVIVIGSLGSQIEDFFGNGSRLGVRLSYIVDNKAQGIAGSLMKAKDRIVGPFFLFLGDIFVVDADIKSSIALMVGLEADAIVIGREEIDPEAVKRNFSVIATKGGRVLKVVEKPRQPPSMFKGYGLYLFSPAIFAAIAKTPKSSLRNELEITDSIQTLIDSGGKVYVQKWKNWDFNLSYPEDLLMCNLKLLKEKKLDNLIGEGVDIDENAQIISSVIGDRVIIGGPMVLEECLVLSDTKVSRRSQPLKRLIFANDYVLPA